MDAIKESEPNAMTTARRWNGKSDRELVLREHLKAPRGSYSRPGRRPSLLKRWWAPKSHGDLVHFLRGRCSHGG